MGHDSDALLAEPVDHALLVGRVGGGRLYRWFMFAYLAFRFGIDFLKPPHGAIGDITTSQGSAYLYANDITAIQLASLIGLILCGATRNVRDKTQSPPGVASGD